MMVEEEVVVDEEEEERSLLSRMARRATLPSVRKAIIAIMDDEHPEPTPKEVNGARTRFEEFAGE